MQVRKSIPTALEFRYNAVIKLSMLRSVSVKIKACCRQQLAEPVGTQGNAFALHTQERRRRQTASHARMSTSMSQLTCDFEDIRRGLVVLQTVCRNKLQPSASMQGQLQVQPASVRRNLCFVVTKAVLDTTLSCSVSRRSLLPVSALARLQLISVY